MGWSDLEAKAHGVLSDVCSESEIELLIAWGKNLEKHGSIRSVHDLLAMAAD